MAKFIDLTGQTFGRLTVVSVRSEKGRRTKLNCICACGTSASVDAWNLTNGKARSCGCLKADTARARNTTHGMSKTTTHKSWECMKNRCLNPNSDCYQNYGGRGITIYPLWIDSFESFLEDMGERPEGTSIDRIDVNGNYEPSNCRWVSRREQSNNIRTNRNITHNGESLSVSEWDRRCGFNRNTIHGRLAMGWTEAESITTPKGKHHKKRNE